MCATLNRRSILSSFRLLIGIALCLAGLLIPERAQAYTPGTYVSHAQWTSGLMPSNILPMYYVTIEDVTRANGYTLTAQTIFNILRTRKAGQRVIDMTNLCNVKLRYNDNYAWYRQADIDAVANYVKNLLLAYKAVDAGNIAPIDAISTDFEGGFSSWGIDSQAICDLITGDPRYATQIKPRLTAYGFVPDGNGELYYVWHWNTGGEPYWRYYHIWNAVAEERVNEYLNTAIWTPAKTYYREDIEYYNYGGALYNMENGFADKNGHQGFIVGGRAFAGNGPSPNLYGEIDQICYYGLKGPVQGLNNPTLPFPATPMNSMRYSLNALRCMRLTDPAVSVWPWVQYRSASDFYGSRMGNTDYYQEMILHIGLCNPKPFIFWYPYGGLGNNDEESLLFNNLLRELDEVAGYPDRRWISDVTTPHNIRNWTNNYYLTGMEAGGRNIWRITPDLSYWGTTVQDFKISDTPPVFAIGSTQIAFPAGSAVFAPTAEYAPAGYWVTSPLGTKPTVSVINQVGTPLISLPSGTYAEAQTVTITCVTAGATIRYSTDGTTPTSASTQYTGPLSITGNTLLRAKAFRAGYSSSVMAAANYTIGSAPANFFTVAYPGARNDAEATVGYEFTPTANITVTALGRSISGTMKQNHKVSIWRVNDSQLIASAIVTPASPVDGLNYAYEMLPGSITLVNGTKYRIVSREFYGGDLWRTSGSISSHQGIATIQQGVSGGGESYPDNVTGAAEQGYAAPTFFTGGAGGQVATPTFTPANGAYAGGQAITITCATAGALIRYTTDGSDPTATSPVYSAPLSLTGSVVLKAKAYKFNMSDSAVGWAAYEMNASMTNFLRGPYNQDWRNERNNLTGNYGYEFTAQAPITIYALGRAVIGGAMNNNHRLKLWRVSNQALLASATVTPASPVDSFGFKYAMLGAPITLVKGETYRLTSYETNGGDKFIINWTPTIPPGDQSHSFWLKSHSPLATINGAVHSTSDVYPTIMDTWVDRGHGTATFFFSSTNLPPTVSLTSPGDGAKFLVGDAVTLSATATDTGGVSKVEFYVDNVKVGEDTTAPYTCDWTMNALGGHAVFVRAIDALSASAETIPINVEGIAPGAGLTARYYRGDAFDINFDSAIEGPLDFDFAGAPPHGLTPPFSVKWTGFLLPRCSAQYTIYERANDGCKIYLNGALLIDDWAYDGVGEESATITLNAGQMYPITVEYHDEDGGGGMQLSWSSAGQPKEIIPAGRLFPANQLPTATLTAPAAGSRYNQPVNIDMGADASDSDGTITKVEFRVDGVKVGEDSTAPYQFTWANASVGAHALTAAAIDNYGCAKSSPPVNIQVFSDGAQPDAEIRAGEGNFVGDGVYNDDGAGQTAARGVQALETAVYYIRFTNEGDIADKFLIFGEEGAENWTVKFFDDLGDEVEGGSWTTPVIAAGGVYTFRLEVTPGPGAGVNERRDVLISVKSFLDNTLSDTVKAVTTRIPLSGVLLAASPAGEQEEGYTVTFTATPIGGDDIEYEFSIQDSENVTTVIRGYAGDNTCVWSPMLVGRYTVTVRAHEVGDPAPESVAASITYSVVEPQLRGVTASAEMQPDKLWRFTATPEGTASGVLYKFRVSNGSTWTDVVPYGTGNVCRWRPTKVGNYTLRAYAKKVSGGVTTEFYADQAFRVTVVPPQPARLSAVNLKASPPSPQPFNSHILLIATPTGGLNVEYRFRVYDGSKWTDLQAFSLNNSVAWIPMLKRRYTLAVYAHEIGSSTTTQVTKSITFDVR